MDRMKFEKVAPGVAAPTGGDIPTAEQLVERSTHPEGPMTSMADRVLNNRTAQLSAEYRARSRAEALLSRQIVTQHSPSARIKVIPQPDSPFAFRFCYGPRREKVTMKGWEPVKDMELAKKVCPSGYLRQEADGKIYSGDSFLCMKPKEAVEDAYATYYRRSRRNAIAASQGGAVAQNADGSNPGDASTFDALHKATSSADDPVGVRMTVRQNQGLVDEIPEVPTGE